MTKIASTAAVAVQLSADILESLTIFDNAELDIDRLFGRTGKPLLHQNWGRQLVPRFFSSNHHWGMLSKDLQSFGVLIPREA